MFQTFETTTRPDQGPPRLAALRTELAREDLDGFLVPRADAHQGENVAPADERLAWLTGFTGSAGFCAVLAEHAAIFIDGRYTVQVRRQVADVFTPVDWPGTKLADWLIAHLGEGGRVGFDPWLHTHDEVAKLTERVAGAGITLVRTDNLVDRVWTDRPAPPAAPIVVYPTEYAGQPQTEKRRRIAEILKEAGEAAAILTLPDSIAWLLNVRGADIVRTPVPLAFAILHSDATCDLFAAPGAANGIADHLGDEVRVHARSDFAEALRALTGKVRVDPATAPVRVTDLLEEGGADVSHADDPCILPKARKTPAEISNSAEAHLRDGAAMVEFLAWLDGQTPGSFGEIDVVRALEGFRRASNKLEDISFETIAGSGPNGAIVHYRVTEETDRRVQAGDLLLVDSGGQYLDGTTDITRTIAIGPVTEFQRICFTRVLQGMIAISRIRWPKGLAGRDLDALARAQLWMAGQDYDHGTGHGVGVYLGVHEGPQRLSRRSEVPLEEGMILSNEPGYYREGAFGIRLENLVAVETAPPLEHGDDREMLHFRTLTFVPVDRRLIVPEMLSRAERAWLDGYHATVAERIGPRLGGPAKHWLDGATTPI